MKYIWYNLPTYLPTYFIYLSICLSVCLSVCISIYIYLPRKLASYLLICLAGVGLAFKKMGADRRQLPWTIMSNWYLPRRLKPRCVHRKGFVCDHVFTCPCAHTKDNAHRECQCNVMAAKSVWPNLILYNIANQCNVTTSNEMKRNVM